MYNLKFKLLLILEYLHLLIYPKILGINHDIIAYPRYINVLLKLKKWIEEGR
jgi:hypothetical protein